MRSGDSPLAGRSLKTGIGSCACGMALLVCLLLVAVSGPVWAASGSTRLTIHLDQNVVDAIARWKGEMPRPAATSRASEAGGLLRRVMPAARAGLAATHHPRSVERILLGLQRDTLFVLDGRAEHAGDAGSACAWKSSAGGRFTVHSY